MHAAILAGFQKENKRKPVAVLGGPNSYFETHKKGWRTDRELILETGWGDKPSDIIQPKQIYFCLGSSGDMFWDRLNMDRTRKIPFLYPSHEI